MKKWTALLLGSLCFSGISAQEEPAQRVMSKAEKSDYFFGGLETSTVPYINTNTKDSSGSRGYLSAYLDFNHRSGVGLRVKTYMLPAGSDPGFFLTSLSAYYAKYDGKLLPLISYTRYLQHDNPSVPYSPISNEIYAHLRVRSKYVDPQAGIDIGFGNDEQNDNKAVTDVNAFFALSHLFTRSFEGNSNSAWAFWPTLQLNAGTDRYFKFLRSSRYLSRNVGLQRLGFGRKRGNPGQSPGNGGTDTTYILSEENEFGVSNIETNFRLMLLLGRFTIEPSGSIFFPLRGSDRKAYGYWQFNISFIIL